MNKPHAQTDKTVQFFCFLILATVGMGVIGLALMAETLVGYYTDHNTISIQKQRLEMLTSLHRQQQELLQNLNNPSVVERVAISNLKYVPARQAQEAALHLPPSWPDLETALTLVENKNASPKKHWIYQISENLIYRPHQRNLLLALGSVLVIISLTFFYRSR